MRLAVLPNMMSLTPPRRRDGRARQRANLRNSIEVATLPPRGEKSRELAARLAGVSPRTVQDAATVRAHDPVLFEQVKDGRIPAERAARRVGADGATPRSGRRRPCPRVPSNSSMPIRRGSSGTPTARRRPRTTSRRCRLRRSSRSDRRPQSTRSSTSGRSTCCCRLPEVTGARCRNARSEQLCR